MKNKNTLSPGEYIAENIYWTGLVYVLYQNWLFCPVFGLNTAWSMVLLLATAIASNAAGILLTGRHRRNYLSVGCNVVLTFGIYFLLSFWNLTRTRLLYSILAAALLTICYAALMAAIFLDERKNKRPIPGRKFFFACFLSTRTIVAFVLAITLMITMARPLLGLPIPRPEAEGKQPMQTTDPESEINEGQTISGNMDTVLLLQEEYWSQLDAEQRLEVLRTIARIEANYLGIAEMDVRSEVLDDKIHGHYTPTNRTITLNLNYLSTVDGRTMLKTLCHECYHAYQFQLVELYNSLDPESKDLLLFFETAQYQKEFSNYIDGTVDYPAYSQQWCESHSNAYAEDAAREYFSRIHQYNESQQAEEEETHGP